MAKLKNINGINNLIKSKVIQSIQNNCKPLISTYLTDMLSKQVDSKGNRFPEKAESTKKQYRYKGWNTTQWLVRTGEATKLFFRNLTDGISVKPEDPQDILQYVKRSSDWFTLNELINNKIIEQIKKDLK